MRKFESWHLDRLIFDLGHLCPEQKWMVLMSIRQILKEINRKEALPDFLIEQIDIERRKFGLIK